MVTSSHVYEWNPKEYARSSDAQKSWGDDFLKNLAFQTTDTVLDLGCGDGIITSGLAKKVPVGYVVGTDISPDMIRYASSQFSLTKHQNLFFMQSDSLKLPFKAVFDVVFSNSSFHWISDHRALLTGIYQVLRPQGRLLVSMGGKGNMGAIINATERVMSKSGWIRYFTGFTIPFTFFDPDEYRLLLKGAGFIVQRLEFIPKDMIQKGREGLTNSIRSVWQPFLERIPGNLRETFLSEVVDILMDENPLDSDGYIHLPMFRLEIEAFIK